MKKVVRVVCVAAALMAAQSASAFVGIAGAVLGGLKLMDGMPPIPLFGTGKTVYGLQLSFLVDHPDGLYSSGHRTENVYGGQLSILEGCGVDDLYGLRLGVLLSGSVISDRSECSTVNGAQIGTLGAASAEVRGIQLAGFAALANELYGVGVAMLNLADDMRGMQIGLVNKAKHADGVQIGLYNEASNGSFLQIGAVNHVPENMFEYFPALNFRFK